MHSHPSRDEPNPHPGSPLGNRTVADAAVLALVLLALSLRTHQLAHKSLWLDEAYSAWISEQRLSDLLYWTVQADQHPPLYYLVARAWVRLGSPPGGGHTSPQARAFWVRLPSAFLSTFTVAVVYALGRRFAGRQVGLTTALLLALSPFHVWFGQEARMYALFAMNVSLAMLGLVSLLTTPHPQPSPGRLKQSEGEGEEILPPVGYTGGREETLPPVDCTGRIEGGQAAWALYVLFTAAALWTHNTAILFWTAANLYVLGTLGFSRWRRAAGPETGSCPRCVGVKNPVSLPLRNWLLAQLCILLLWSPWLAPFARQAAGVDREFWLPAPTWGALAGTLNTFLSAHLPQHLAWLSLAWLACSILLGAGVYALRERRALLLLLITLFVTPIAGELLASLRRPIFYTRTLIWATVPFYLLLAIGAARALSARSGRRTRCYTLTQVAGLASLATLIVANTSSLQNYYTNYHKEAWDEAAEHVSQQVQPGDLILFNASWVQLPFDFYFNPAVEVVRHGVPIDLFDVGTLEPRMTEQDLPRLMELVRGHDRAWLIYSHNWYTDPQGLIPEILAQHGALSDRKRFRGIEVHLYHLPGP